MNKKHLEVVAAVIIKNKQIFCCKRGPKGECAFKWEFPGGKIEQGEKPEEALVREIKEELSCQIKITHFLTTIEHEYQTFTITMHVYLCELIDGTPLLSEHVEAKWCEAKRLSELDFAEADYKFLPLLKNII